MLQRESAQFGDLPALAPQLVEDLGELARAFGRMVDEINQREAALRAQLAEIQRLDVDAASRSQAVTEITESEYFQQLRAKVMALRRR